LPFLPIKAAEGDEMVTNPHYKYWSNHKPGSTSTRVEETAFSGPDQKLVPDGVDHKEIAYKLLSVTPEKVVVQFLVREREFLGTVESAPKKWTYPAKIKKSHLRAGLHDIEPTVGEETITWKDEKLACRTLSGTEKKGGVEVDHKVWLSEKVPGGIVKHHRVTKQDDKVVADTKITLKSYKSAE
jgi:hypothetical protein